MDYYSHARPEIANLVPSDVKIVVDIGCGAGALGSLLKTRGPQVEVRGVELTKEAADIAKRNLDDCARQSAEEAMPAHWPAPECLIFADVLEHLVNPWAVLKQWTGVLQPEGKVVISLPNVAHRSIIRGLNRDRFEYADEGILDRTHLRFFTESSALALIEGAGLKVIKRGRNLTRSLIPVVGPMVHSYWLKSERHGANIPKPFKRSINARTSQFLFLAQKVS